MEPTANIALGSLRTSRDDPPDLTWPNSEEVDPEDPPCLDSPRELDSPGRLSRVSSSLGPPSIHEGDFKKKQVSRNTP